MSSIFVQDCPRCGATKTTFDCYATQPVGTAYGWKALVEVFAVCRTCQKSCILLTSQKEAETEHSQYLRKPNAVIGKVDPLSKWLAFERVVSSLDNRIAEPPAYLPEDIHAVVLEGNKCLAAQCWNAAGAMYRLALDMATKGKLSADGEPNAKIRRSLGLRLNWMFENGVLPKDLQELASCIQQDGNDGAHDGTLSKEDAEDLQDFSYELLKRTYTDPERLRLANERRITRRSTSKTN